MKIVKTPNKSPAGYYVVKIIGFYNDGDGIATEECYNENEFQKILPALKVLLKKCIGYHVWENFEGSEDDYDLIYNNLEIPCTSQETCHTINDVSIKYYDEDGRSFIVSLEDDEDNNVAEKDFSVKSPKASETNHCLPPEDKSPSNDEF